MKSATARKVRTLKGLRYNSFGVPCLVLALADRAFAGEHVRIKGESTVYKLGCATTIDQTDKTERWTAEVV